MLPTIFTIAAQPWPRIICWVESYIQVEKVVYAPTNPTATASRVVSEMFPFEPAWARNQPRIKLPVILMKSVPTGNVVGRVLSQNLPITSLAKAPKKPATPTARHWIMLFMPIDVTPRQDKVRDVSLGIREMKVLLVHNFYQQPGGEDQVFAEEGKLLEDHGHTVGRWTVDNDDIAGMGKLTLARKTIGNKDSRETLKAKIREIGAEVVHFHNTFPLVSPAAYGAAHEAGAAVVQTLHNYRLMCPAATFYRADRVCEDCMGKAIPWPAVLHGCYRGRMASGVATAMLSYHRMAGTWQKEVDAYIALTEFARKKFIEGGLTEAKLRVKPNFVDPDPGPGKGGGDYILFAGRLTKEKGVMSVIEAWKAHRPALKLRMIGDGPLREQVEQAIRGEPAIEYLGRRPLPEVYELMGGAAGLVFPSEWYEGMPKTIVESFAKGTPVIASNLGSMPEMIDPGMTGFLFEPGNPADLARQVARLTDGQANLLSMREAARQVYQQRFTAAQNYPVLMEIYGVALRSFSAK